MAKRDPRKLPICDVHWWDAFDGSERLGAALRNTSLVHQVTTGRISKKTKRIIQVVTSAEQETGIDDADCNYTNIPADWVFKIEKHRAIADKE